MLRILLISPNYPPNPFTCGVGDYSQRIAAQLRLRGHEIEVLASRRYAGSRLTDNGVKVTRFSARWSFIAGVKLLFLAAKREHDIISLQSTPTLYQTSFRILLPLVNIFTPIVVSFHTLFGGSFLSRLEFLYVIFSSRLIISTNEEVSHILKKLPYYGKRFTEIPIASNIVPPSGIFEQKIQLREQLGLPAKTCVLANFGLFYPGKGLSCLLEACAILKRTGFPFFLMLLGALRNEDKEYIDSMRDKVKDLRLGKQVKFYGEQNEQNTSQCIAAADIYVVPYDKGSSIRRGTLWAGLSHGVPVITTLPTMPSKFISSDTAKLVPPKSPQALADAVVSLYSSQESKDRLVHNALRLSREFSWEPIVARLESEYSRVARRSK